MQLLLKDNLPFTTVTQKGAVINLYDMRIEFVNKSALD